MKNWSRNTSTTWRSSNVKELLTASVRNGTETPIEKNGIKMPRSIIRKERRKKVLYLDI